MEKDKRTGWLKDLKEGDEVFLIGELLHEVFLQKVAIIEKITPAGRIKAGGYKFNQCGRFEKTDFCSVRLEKLTPEMKSKLLLNTERERLEAKAKVVINKIDVSKLSDEKLGLLYTFLEEINNYRKRERLEAKVKNAINDINVSEFNNEELKCLSTFLGGINDWEQGRL